MNPRLRDNIPLIESLVRAYPRAYSVHACLANLLHDAGRKRAATRQLLRNAALFPDSPSPYFQRARWAMNAQDWLGAARWLTKCLRKDNGYFRNAALFRRGECFFQAGKLDLAQADFAALPDGYEEFGVRGVEFKSKAQMLDAVQLARSHET